MQRLAFVLGLTACYQSGAEAPCTVLCGTASAASACPGDLVCNPANNLCALANGSCTVDGPGDAESPSALCAVPPTLVTPVPLTIGRWYVVDRMSGRGVKARGQTMLGTANRHTQTETDFVDLSLVRPADASLYAPRLGYGGTEIHLTMQHTDSVTLIVRSTRDILDGQWSPPVTQSLVDETTEPVPLFGDEVASPPTTTIPRRMLLSSTTIGSLLDEYVEQGANRWQRLRSHPTQFAGVEYIGQATLSEEGRRLVFLGRVAGGVPQGFYVERPSVTVAFPQQATRIPVDDTSIMAGPFLTSDCRHFYYNTVNDQIFHVAFP